MPNDPFLERSYIQEGTDFLQHIQGSPQWRLLDPNRHLNAKQLFLWLLAGDYHVDNGVSEQVQGEVHLVCELDLVHYQLYGG